MFERGDIILFSEAIKRFLELNTFEDLSALYNSSQEVQILVEKGDGVKIEGDFKGRSGNSFTDNVTTWFSYRLPKNAFSEPEDNDITIPYDLSKHALGIGMSGWDWKNKVSKWVGLDFDSLMGHADKHSKKLSDVELRDIERIVANIPWVTVRRSTSGNGRHLYIFVNNVPCISHTEHSALARSILGMMSAITGYDFQSKVDALGGILWQWHRKMVGTNGLELIKQGSVLENIPQNWKDHLVVISGKKSKVVPFWIESVS